jgi:hypothetical protein
MMQQLSIRTIQHDLARMKAVDQIHLETYRGTPIFDLRPSSSSQKIDL